MAAPSTTIAERIRGKLGELPAAERRVALLLLSSDPVTALEPVAALAARAHASPPTVLRLLDRLGFEGYPSFQQAVKAELAARLSSPLQMYPSGPAAEGLAERMLDDLGHSVLAARTQLATGELDAAAALLADQRRPVVVIGGRFSAMLADYLVAHLQLLRPGVARVPAAPSDRAAMLLDVDRRHIVVAFDYRRYQHDTVAFGTGAADRRASVVLFTDRYLSPLASRADVVLSTEVAAPSPFDVLTPAVALVETLVACLVDRLGDEPRSRIAAFDAVSAQLVEGAGGVAGTAGATGAQP